jgi:hypothetical protein
VINAAVLFKIAWTFYYDSTGDGALAHLPTALIGLVVVDAGLIGAGFWVKRRAAAAAITEADEATAPAEVR